MYGKGLLKGMNITLRHHLGKKITKQYPDEYPDLAPRFRGSLEYDIDKCIACNACARACPNGVLSMETGKGADGKRRVVSFTIDLQYCMFCAFCTEACPNGSLYFTPKFELACFEREQSKKTYLAPAAAEVPPAEIAAVSEQNAALEKKQEMVKKLAGQIAEIKKELQDETLDTEARQQKEGKLNKLTNALGKVKAEIKELREAAAAAPAQQAATDAPPKAG